MAFSEFAWEALRHTFEDRQNMLRAEKPGYARTRLRKGSGHSMKSNYLCMKLTNSEARKHSHRDTHKHTHVSWAFLSSNSNRLTTVSQVLRKTVQCLISRFFISFDNRNGWVGRRFFVDYSMVGLLDAQGSLMIRKIPRMIDFNRFHIFFGAVHAAFWV